MKTLDLAYTAGLFDGEGTITLSKRNSDKFRSPSISMTNTSYELLKYLKDIYGGCICNHKIYKDHHKQSWSWHLTHNSAISFCSNILPYSKEKSKIRRMKLIIRFYKLLTPRNGKYTEYISQKRIKFERIFFSS